MPEFEHVDLSAMAEWRFWRTYVVAPFATAIILAITLNMATCTVGEAISAANNREASAETMRVEGERTTACLRAGGTRIAGMSGCFKVETIPLDTTR